MKSLNYIISVQAHVGPVAVDPQCQGQGIGKLLLDFPETISDSVVIGETIKQTVSG
jgi:ribosomal protein S18 acetylase RimI-like enzyme